MLDGTENNSAYFSGEDQIFAIADAIEEVSSLPPNHLHGALLWRYQSQRFDSISNLDRLTGVPQSVFSNNIYGFTVGGPV